MEHYDVLQLVDQDYQEEAQRWQCQSSTNADCLREILHDQNIRFRVQSWIARNVCEYFGRVLQVEQKDAAKFLVLFENIVDCFFAQRVLNDHFINDLNVHLLLRWGTHQELQEFGRKQKQLRHCVALQFNSFPKEDAYHKKQQQQPPKFTCRYEILIDNESDFQVARKIIGSKGCNMKKIIDQCNDGNSQVVKLRLRGKGSGYKEGPSKTESNEPLHLCISSKSNQLYQRACSLVEQLLNKINEDYKQYCFVHHRKPNQSFYRKLTNQNKPQSMNHMVHNSYYEFPPLLIPKMDKLMMR